jgi:hypothetical protein
MEGDGQKFCFGVRLRIIFSVHFPLLNTRENCRERRRAETFRDEGTENNSRLRGMFTIEYCAARERAWALILKMKNPAEFFTFSRAQSFRPFSVDCCAGLSPQSPVPSIDALTLSAFFFDATGFFSCAGLKGVHCPTEIHFRPGFIGRFPVDPVPE